MELPLGATEDRICGTINIEKALQEGVKAYEPGLLVSPLFELNPLPFFTSKLFSGGPRLACSHFDLGLLVHTEKCTSMLCSFQADLGASNGCTARLSQAAHRAFRRSAHTIEVPSAVDCAQAKANRGILYVDEVNLLDDGLVDVVLDSSASGVNTVEREGIGIVHPAKFIMIGSGNPQARTCPPPS